MRQFPFARSGRVQAGLPAVAGPIFQYEAGNGRYGARGLRSMNEVLEAFVGIPT